MDVEAEDRAWQVDRRLDCPGQGQLVFVRQIQPSHYDEYAANAIQNELDDVLRTPVGVRYPGAGSNIARN